MSELAIISSRSANHLKDKICSLPDMLFYPFKINTEIRVFPNGEMLPKFNDSVREKDVFIIATLGNNPNEDLMETLLLIRTAREASAKRITAVLPIIYGSRQDRKTRPRVLEEYWG